MILNVTALESGYGRIPILHGIDFSIAEGEYVGIWGHNGMGKTTLLSTILGYRKATAGRIEFDGVDVTQHSTHLRARAGLGLVPQGRQIFSNLTVFENLKAGGIMSGNKQDDPTERVLEYFPRLKPLLGRSGGLLSGGEQQLLALGRCLCGNPKMILLDEPTEGIQPNIIDEISDTLNQLRKEQNLTLIVVEQNRDFITSLAHRVLVMQKGLINKSITSVELADYAALH